MTTWAYRLRVECHADDVDTLRQIAVDVCEAVLPDEDAEAQRQTFVEQPGGTFACSLAATDELRVMLDSMLGRRMSEGLINHPVLIRRHNVITQTVEAAYSVTKTPDGIVALLEGSDADPEPYAPYWTPIAGAALGPQGAESGYPLGAVVFHDGKAWMSTVAHNVWEPGVSGWQPVGTPDSPPAWIQPTGAHDAYALGATVTHKNALWTSTVDFNVWEPGVFGWDKNLP